MANDAVNLDFYMIDFEPYREGRNMKHKGDSKTLSYVLKLGYSHQNETVFIKRITEWLTGLVNEKKVDIIMLVPGHSPFVQNEQTATAWTTILTGVSEITGAERGVLRRFMEVPKSTSSQGRRNKAVHKGSIVVDNPKSVDRKKVLIVDDVYTSGATMSACYELVKEAGAAAVFTAVVGKTVPE